MSAIFNTYCEGILQRLSGSEPLSLANFRSDTFHKLVSKGFPATDQEEWKYTSLRNLSQSKLLSPGFTLGHFASVDSLDSLQKSFVANGPRYFVINGKPVDSTNNMGCEFVDVSSANLSTDSISCFSLSTLMRAMAGTEGVGDSLRPVVEAAKSSFAAIANRDSSYFGLFNTTVVEDGLFFFAPKGCQNKTHVSVIHLVVPGQADDGYLAITPRIVVYAEEGARISIDEIYIVDNPSDARYIISPVTHIIAEEGAQVNHLKLQMDSKNSYHLGSMTQDIHADANVSSAIISFGGLVVRNDYNSHLLGKGGKADIKGLTLLRGSQHVDNNITVHHHVPNCESQQTFRGIFGERSRGVFTGTIVVDRDAQKTNAYQSNRNILLSADAAVDSRPQLKIFADDVKCSHGATVGQLDGDGLFYLQSRGIPQSLAKVILARSFCSAVIDNLPIPSMRDRVSQLLEDRLAEQY